MRKIKITNSAKPEKSPHWSHLDELVGRANDGDQLAIEELGTYLDLHPTIVSTVADLASHLEQDFISRIAKDDELLKQSLIKKIASLRKELTFDPFCPIQRLATERAIVHQLETWMLALMFPDITKIPGPLARKVQVAKNHAERRSRSALVGLQHLRQHAPKRAKASPINDKKPRILKLKRSKGKRQQKNYKSPQARSE